MNTRVKNMILAALMLALCWLLPFITAINPAISKAISPMHIPVFLCGFMCSMPWAPIVGFCAPLLRSFTTGMPPLFPTALAMSFELATYGLITTLLSSRLPKKPVFTYISLIGAMLAGRLVWGLASLALYGLSGSPFTMEMFLASAFTNAIPGIVFHIVLIPAIILALRRAKLIK